jgi:hypothetical protein
MISQEPPTQLDVHFDWSKQITFSLRALEQNLAAAPAFFRGVFRLQFLGAFYV